MGPEVPCSAPKGMRHLREKGRAPAGQVLPAALPWDLGTCTKLLMPGVETTSAPLRHAAGLWCHGDMVLGPI